MAFPTARVASVSPTGEELLDAAIDASRVLVAVAARSLAGAAEDVTLPQFRALVVLSTCGPQRVADLAAELAVNASTATRMCDRLVRKHLVTRSRLTSDRRTVRIVLSDHGSELVAEVMARRRLEMSQILERMPVADRPQLVQALRSLTTAAGELPARQPSLDWRCDTAG